MIDSRRERKSIKKIALVEYMRYNDSHMPKNKMVKKRVLQVNKFYYPFTGGIEKVVQQIAEGLNDVTDMSVLTCSKHRKLIKEIVHGVKVVRVPSLFVLGNMPIPLGFISQFRKLSKNTDVVHIHMPYPFADLAYLLSGYQGKVVVWWHSDVVRQKKMMFFYKTLMYQLLKRADVIIVATKGHIKGSKYLGSYREKCVIIPFGVEKEVEEKADLYMESKQQIVQNEYIKKVRFLFVGRLVYYKGCKVLLEAFANVSNAELILVGSGVMEEELKQMAKELCIDGNVTFLGEVSQEKLCREFERCDVFVLPSIARSEAFGIVQIEAMAFGKPVINTKLPSGVPFVSVHNKTGLTVQPGSVDELSRAMKWMVSNPEKRMEMGKRARERMKEKYRMETMLEKVLKIYDS